MPSTLTAAVLFGLLSSQTARAADHTEDGKVVGILCFAGAGSTTTDGVYDPEVLYGFHIDNNGDNVADLDVWARFGQDGDGAWGLQVLDLPGGDADVQGPVETVIDAGGGLSVWAGPADDPFFFDLEGYSNTLALGSLFDKSANLTFDSTRDFFAGLNVTAIAVEMAAGSVADTNHNLQIWATTSRL
jgi:hypothetical protein